MRAPLVLAIPVLASIACSASEPPREHASSASSAIINGSADTTHQAVVALALQQGNEGGLCSGTIVKVDTQRKIGWILTAAHCVTIPPVLVVQGDDFNDPKATHYQIIDYLADSRYDPNGSAGQPYDFAVVRFAGADATTPTIPIIGSPDGVGQSTPVVAVGYGRTTLNSSGTQDTNSLRRSVPLSVYQTSSTELRYDMSLRGICQGDSGGPDLVKVGGVEKVAGVHSFVEGDCNGFGDSGRVTSDLSFINGELTKALPADDCGLCDKVANSGNGECSALTSACLSDPDCKGYYDCLTQCGGTTTCKTTCAAKFPKAEGPFAAAAGCTCTRACATECGTLLECRGVPKCGYKFPAGDCTTCTESTCCQEALDCGADGECYVCLKNGDADAACATNAARQKLATCVAKSCSTQCAGTGLDTGADPDAGTDPATKSPVTVTTTTTGCSVARGAGGAGGASGVGLAGVALALAAARRRARAQRRR
jgi:hypothetical protein